MYFCKRRKTTVHARRPCTGEKALLKYRRKAQIGSYSVAPSERCFSDVRGPKSPKLSPKIRFGLSFVFHAVILSICASVPFNLKRCQHRWPLL